MYTTDRNCFISLIFEFEAKCKSNNLDVAPLSKQAIFYRPVNLGKGKR